MQFSILFANFAQGAVYAVIAFLFIVEVKKIADKRTTTIDDDHEILEQSNLAVGLRRTGLTIAFAIAFSGTLSGVSAGFTGDVIALFIDGVLITVCLFACRSINDRVMMAHIDNDEEARKGNVAVGLAECGMYMATGFVLNGSFSGGSGQLMAGAVSAIVFFLAGQAALLICGYCYELMTPFNIRDEIQKGNVAAGIALAGMLIAIGIILRASIAGPSVNWTVDLISFGLYTVYGIVLLLIFKMAIDRFLLPHTKIAVEVERDRNIAALALTEAAVIAVAIVISSVM